MSFGVCAAIIFEGKEKKFSVVGYELLVFAQSPQLITHNIKTISPSFFANDSF
jgi:hypothetical protein